VGEQVPVSPTASASGNQMISSSIITGHGTILRAGPEQQRLE